MGGHFAEARELLTAATEVLRAEPDTDTVRVLRQLAVLEVAACSPDADRVTTEALTLGQDQDVGAGQLIRLFGIRAIYLKRVGRRPEAIAYFREAVRLAEQAGDNLRLGGVLVNLADALLATDPAAAVEAARTASEHVHRAGAQGMLAYAVGNLVEAWLMLGDWDAADDALTRALDSDALTDFEYLSCFRGWLAALLLTPDGTRIVTATPQGSPSSPFAPDSPSCPRTSSSSTGSSGGGTARPGRMCCGLAQAARRLSSLTPRGKPGRYGPGYVLGVLAGNTFTLIPHGADLSIQMAW